MCKERVSFVSYFLYSRKEYRLYPTVCTQGKSLVCILLFVLKERVSFVSYCLYSRKAYQSIYYTLTYVKHV